MQDWANNFNWKLEEKLKNILGGYEDDMRMRWEWEEIKIKKKLNIRRSCGEDEEYMRLRQRGDEEGMWRRGDHEFRIWPELGVNFFETVIRSDKQTKRESV